MKLLNFKGKGLTFFQGELDFNDNLDESWILDVHKWLLRLHRWMEEIWIKCSIWKEVLILTF